jgi:hypothetical protein
MAEETAPAAAEAPLVPGLTIPNARSLERFPIRTRESGVTRSGWRLSVTSGEGDGAIVLVEVSSNEPLYRGEGVFLGWAQERLRCAYDALLPRADDGGFEIAQLG